MGQKARVALVAVAMLAGLAEAAYIRDTASVDTGNGATTVTVVGVNATYYRRPGMAGIDIMPQRPDGSGEWCAGIGYHETTRGDTEITEYRYVNCDG